MGSKTEVGEQLRTAAVPCYLVVKKRGRTSKAR